MNAIRNRRKALEATAKPAKKTAAKPTPAPGSDWVMPSEEMVPLTSKHRVTRAELEAATLQYQRLMRGGLAALRFLSASEQLASMPEVRAIIADLAQVFPDEDTTP